MSGASHFDMPQRRPLRRVAQYDRRGTASRGLIIALAGVSDIILAVLLWLFIGRDDMLLTAVFGLIAISGFGIVGFGVMTMLEDA